MRRIISRKMIVMTSALFALFLIYMIPKDEIKELTVSEKIEYVEHQLQEQPVFLMNRDGFLSRSKVAMSENTNTLGKIKEAITTLIQEGPNESRIPSGFQAVIPSDTKIRGIDLKDGILKIDFSKELLDVKTELEEKVIEAIVYTATSFQEVKSVILFMEGDIITKLPKSGTILPSAFDRSFGINKTYDITSPNNVNQVTVYYVDEIGGQSYYVPVTKYVNDERDKIKIIIDELASSHQYQTNLMSFLNSNTKLLNVEETDGVLSLDFNSYIFHDIESKDILEEVIYTICLSVSDQYDVKEVVFEVNQEEVHTSVLDTIKGSQI